MGGCRRPVAVSRAPSCSMLHYGCPMPGLGCVYFSPFLADPSPFPFFDAFHWLYDVFLAAFSLFTVVVPVFCHTIVFFPALPVAWCQRPRGRNGPFQAWPKKPGCAEPGSGRIRGAQPQSYWRQERVRACLRGTPPEPAQNRKQPMSAPPLRSNRRLSLLSLLSSLSATRWGAPAAWVSTSTRNGNDEANVKGTRRKKRKGRQDRLVQTNTDRPITGCLQSLRYARRERSPITRQTHGWAERKCRRERATRRGL